MPGSEKTLTLALFLLASGMTFASSVSSFECTPPSVLSQQSTCRGTLRCPFQIDIGLPQLDVVVVQTRTIPNLLSFCGITSSLACLSTLFFDSTADCTVDGDFARFLIGQTLSPPFYTTFQTTGLTAEEMIENQLCFSQDDPLNIDLALQVSAACSRYNASINLVFDPSRVCTP